MPWEKTDVKAQRIYTQPKREATKMWQPQISLQSPFLGL